MLLKPFVCLFVLVTAYIKVEPFWKSKFGYIWIVYATLEKNDQILQVDNLHGVNSALLMFTGSSSAQVYEDLTARIGDSWHCSVDEDQHWKPKGHQTCTFALLQYALPLRDRIFHYVFQAPSGFLITLSSFVARVNRLFCLIVVEERFGRAVWFTPWRNLSSKVIKSLSHTPLEENMWCPQSQISREDM